MKTFQVRTLGCKVNQYESQLLREKLLATGFTEAKFNKADIYIINTCTVTQKAESESRGLIRRAHVENRSAKILVTGCSVYGKEAGQLLTIKGVSTVVDNSQKENLPNLILSKTSKSLLKKNTGKGITKFAGHTRAFVKIQDGCNNGCSYCIVPKVRGSSHSRTLNDIKEEVENLVANGYKEIVLCGICLGAYARDLKPPSDLCKAISELEKVDGLLRIRLSSIEASDVTDELIEKLVNSKKLCRHLHIPFQSGDNKILKLMNRKLDVSDYLRLIARLRQSCPDIGITTDIIAGFPYEDENCFDNTVEFLNKAKPSRIHVFSYSPRRDTGAFNFKNKVPEYVIKKRVNWLRRLGAKLSAHYCRSYIDKTLSVLIESDQERKLNSKPELYQGYSDNYIKSYISGKKDIRNRVVSVRVSRLYRDGVFGLVS